MNTRTDTSATDGRGLIVAVSVFLVCGLLPIYLRQLQAVPVLAHVASTHLGLPVCVPLVGGAP